MFFKTKEHRWENVDKGIERQIIGYDNSLMMVMVRFQKDAIGVLHQHVHSQATYIAEGKFEVCIEDEKVILEKGDSFFAETNKVHGVVCLEEGLLVDTFSPMREDFLK